MTWTLYPKTRARSGGGTPKVKKARGKARRSLIGLLFNRSPKEAPSGSAHEASDWLESIADDLDRGSLSKAH